MIDRLQVASRLFNQPLMILPEKASVIAEVLMGGNPASIDLDHLGVSARQTVQGPAREALPFELSNGVAVIPVIGSLVNRGGWIGASSGLVSYDGLKRQFAAAAGDDRVKSVVLDIDSPGGEAVGCFECADALSALASRKTVTAFVNGLAASAAYGIASAATKIVTIPTGVVGSIGVVMLHRDYSGALAKAGVKPTMIFAGAHKVDGHPFSALPESVHADLQGEIDSFYDLFVACVAKNRRMSASAVRATEARTYIGRAAIEAGLADEIGTIEAMLSQSGGGGPSANISGRQFSTSAPTLPLTVAQVPNTSAAIEAEQRRISAILTSPGAQKYPTAAKALAEQPSITPEAAEELFRIADAEGQTPRRSRDGRGPLGLCIVSDIKEFLASRGSAGRSSS